MIARPDLPYPGLRAFARDENIVFFGRDGCVDRMVATLAETRFLAVLGTSGSGKSSLVRTGLLHALERGTLFEAGSDWLIADFHPGSRPMRALAEALSPAAEIDEVDALEDHLATWPGSLVEWAQWGNLPPGRSLLLLVDQFEELFRYGDFPEREAAEAFVALLLHSAESRDVPVYVVLTMRSEYLGNCSLIPRLTERINEGLYLTPRMGRESCREAIEGPARVFDFSIEPKLVNHILNDMASFAPFENAGESGPIQLSRRADQLPLLQHLLNRLWTLAREEGRDPIVLGFDDYEAIGGLEGALNRHGKTVIEALPGDAQAAVRTVFRALVRGSDPASAVRRAVPFAALEAEAGEAARLVVDAFRAPDCNFLRPEAHVPLGPDTPIDISHESLIRQWDRLAEWTREEARAAESWQRLIDGAVRWMDKRGELLTGLDLASLSQWWTEEQPTPQWAERHGGKFAEVERYLEASRAAETAAREREELRERREWRRLVVFSAVTGLLALVSAGALVWLWSNNVTLANQRIELAGLEARVESAREEAESVREAAAAQLESGRKEAVEIAKENAAARGQLADADRRIREAEVRVKSAEDMREALRDFMSQNPEESDIYLIAQRAVDACNKNLSDPMCGYIRSGELPAGE